MTGVAIGWTGGRGPARPLASGPLTLAVATAAALVLSIPFRAAVAIEGIDLSRAAYGVLRWEEDESGVRFRWTHERATLFAREDARLIELPITASRRPPEAPEPTVEIRIDDRAVDGFTLAKDETRRIRLEAPEASGPYWRIDLYVTPTWDPHVPGVRPLGVVLRDVEVITRRPFDDAPASTR